MLEIVLVSKSPRRKDILEKAGFIFTVHTMEVSENIDEKLNSEAIVKAISQTKGEAYRNSVKPLELQGKLVVSADTIVVLDGKILGKPTTEQQAEEFLKNLSEKTHSVMTAVYVFNSETEEKLNFVECTEVYFKKLTEEEIKAYVKTGDPMDKAGAYGIQGEAKNFVKKFDGSFWNVVGFPIEAFEKQLNEKKWHVRKK